MDSNTADPSVPLSAAAPAQGTNGPLLTLAPEDIPNLDKLVIEDGKPVENIFAEKQQRLLTEPLYSSWPGPGEGGAFLALANVGLFYAVREPPLAPDVMLSLDVRAGEDLSRKENRSYFVWVMGKPPDVVIEFVSDRRGGEATHKMRQYARIGVPYYVIFDPEEWLEGGVVQAFGLREGKYEPINLPWLPGVGLGLTLWEGAYEDQPGRWLRWCGQQGAIIPTGRERAEQERQRAERLAAQLRAPGAEPAP